MQLPPINADIGEDLDAIDEKLIPFIDWANIACGAHAGSVESIRKSLKHAIMHRVKIGAHPSYPDRKHFGRRSMHMDKTAFQESIRQQLFMIIGILNELGASLHHIKPHGALYHDLTLSSELSRWFLDVIKSIGIAPTIVCQPNAVLLTLAKETGFKIMREGFLDRRYLPDGHLAPRNRDQAVIENKEGAIQQLKRWLDKGDVETLDGSALNLNIDTFCLHGDNPGALKIAKSVRETLKQRG